MDFKSITVIHYIHKQIKKYKSYIKGNHTAWKLKCGKIDRTISLSIKY